MSSAQCLPETEEEAEGGQQGHQGDAVTQEVDDHSNLVVRLTPLLEERGERREERGEKRAEERGEE